MKDQVKYVYAGPVMVSTGQRVRIVALGKAKAVRIGGTRSKKHNKVNAKTSTKGEVAINGLGVKIAGRKVKAALAV